MAHVVESDGFDGDLSDDAVFSGALSQGLIWIEDDNDEEDEDVSHKTNHAINTNHDIFDIESSKGELNKQRTLSKYNHIIDHIAISGDFVILALSDKNPYPVSFFTQRPLSSERKCKYSLNVWNWKTSEHVRKLNEDTTEINCIAVEDDIVISSSSDKNLRLWNWKSGQYLQILSGHTQDISFLALNGEIVASGTTSEIRVWNWKTAELLHTFSVFPVMYGHTIKALSVKSEFLLLITSGETIVYNWQNRESLHKLYISVKSSEDLIIEDYIVANIEPYSQGVWDWKTGRKLDKSEIHNKENTKLLAKIHTMVAYCTTVADWSYSYDEDDTEDDIYRDDNNTYHECLTALSEDGSYIITAEFSETIGGLDVFHWSPTKSLSLTSHSENSHIPLKKEMRKYNAEEVVNAAINYINKRTEPWVNFSRVSHYLHELFPKLNVKQFGTPNKPYNSLIKFFADQSKSIELRQDTEKQGLFWIRLKQKQSSQKKKRL